MATNGPTEPIRALIGNAQNFWLYSSKTGFDLTHPSTPSSPPITPSLTLETMTSPIIIDPAKSALIIIDMQNFFLSTLLGKTRGPGHEAMDQLVEHAIPACRAGGIRVVWVNWGLTEREVEEMPPAVKRAFRFEAVCGDVEEGSGVDKHGKPRESAVNGMGKRKVAKGIGTDMGTVLDPDTGKEIEWNTALCPPLDKIYEEGKHLSGRPDVWIHKNRMSGRWGARTELEDFLEQEGLRTLLFAGVNTDQCVNGTYQDSFSKGYDCILLSDGYGTTSPEFAQKGVEYNAAKTCGFMTSCEKLAEGVAKMERRV